MINKVRLLLKQRRIEKSALARSLGLKPQTVTNWFARDKIPEKYTKAIANFFKLPVELFYTDDLSFEEHVNSIESEIQAHAEASLKRNGPIYHKCMIPIIGIVAGGGAEGHLDNNMDIVDYYNCDKRLFPRHFDPKNVALIRIVGDSMSPYLEENDWALIDMVNSRHFNAVNGVYLVRYGNTVQIKNVEFLGNGDIICSSTNANYRSFQPQKDYGLDWEIMGKICGRLKFGSPLLIQE